MAGKWRTPSKIGGFIRWEATSVWFLEGLLVGLYFEFRLEEVSG